MSRLGFVRAVRSSSVAVAICVVLASCSSGPEVPSTSGTSALSTGSNPTTPVTPTTADSTSASQPVTRTTPVFPSNGGNISETIDEISAITLPEQPISSPAELKDAEISITAAQRVTVEAGGPGEFAGPAVAFTIAIENRSTEPLDLTTVSVSVLDSTDAPLATSTAAPAVPFAESVPVAGEASATYVFSNPQSLSGPFNVLVSYSTEAPVVVFVGDAT